MTIITANATKESADSKLGVAFSRKDIESPLVIKTVRDDGLFHGLGLVAGMVVDEVNGVNMTWKTPKDAADSLRLATGPVSITAIAFEGEVIKEEKTSKLGISLKNSTKMEGIFVSKIGEDSPFASSDLAVGMKVLTINGDPCPDTTKAAIRILKDTIGSLKIVAADHNITPPSEPVAQEEPAAEPVAAEAVATPAKEEPASEPAEEAPEKEEEQEKEEDDEEEEQEPSEEPVADEKKEDDPAKENDVPEEEAPEIKETKTEEALEKEPKKGLLDTMFASCIC